MSDPRLEADLRRVAHDLAEAHPNPLRHPFASAEQRLSDLALRDEEVRAALFRLVDVAPACRTPEEVGRHLGSLLGEVGEPAPAVGLARRSVRHRAGRVAAGTLARRGVNRTGRRFIVAQSTREAGAALGRLWASGVAATVDLLGEATGDGRRGGPLRRRLRPGARRPLGGSSALARAVGARA